MIAATLLALMAHVLAPRQHSAQNPAAQGTASDSVRTAALRAAWREAIELDVPGEILADGAWIEAERDADPELAALYALALHSAGLDERAARVLARGDSAPLVLAATRIALDRDEVARALELLANAAGTARFPADPECWLLLGRAQSRAGQLARAEPNLVEFVKRAPWHVEAPQAWFLLVDAARSRGDAAEALRREESRAKSAEWHAFYRARRLQVRANPKEPLPRLGLAQLWLAAGELEKARTAVETALALDARFCRGLETLAEIDRRDGRLDAARARCEAALACDPKLVEVHLTLARIARDGGDVTGAAEKHARYRELGGSKDL